MSQKKVLITQAGYNKLNDELTLLTKVKRFEVMKLIEQAREHGDLSENSEYHAAKDQQRIIEKKIHTIKQQLNQVQVVHKKPTDVQVIEFGATVEFENINNNQKLSYTIVGQFESDIKKNKISILSPIAKSFLRKRVEDIVEVELPDKRQIKYKIISVKYKNHDQKE